jgi:hypothetical protein
MQARFQLGVTCCIMKESQLTKSVLSLLESGVGTLACTACNVLNDVLSQHTLDLFS